MRLLPLLFVLAACTGPSGPPGVGVPTSSSTLAITADDRTLWVVTPDADSVSAIDLQTRTLRAEVALGALAPAAGADGRFEPVIKPRALALLPGDRTLYVAGQTANQILVVDAQTFVVRAAIPVGAEPTAVVAAADGRTVYAVSHQAATVSRIDPAMNAVVATLPIGPQPWGASLSADGRSLYVTHFLLEPGVTVIDTGSFTVRNVVPLAEQPRHSAGKKAPNGVARGLYAAVPRPGTGELWVPHLLLAVDTPQPALDFESTVFPTLSTIAPDGRVEGRRLLFAPLDPPGLPGAFSDVVSGPRAVAFTPDGAVALVAMSQSEDVMVFDAARGVAVGLVRPLPGAFLEGIAVDHAGRRAYVDGRNTHDVTVLALDPARPATTAVDGPPIDRITRDPMPADLRLGQRLFYSANSAAFPITKNFWMACSTCHLEGGTDAVTWRFAAGPRDTPTNAGGPDGFLLRQALRNTVAQYDLTIQVEQGGTYDRKNPAQRAELDALAAFVNRAIPLPQNPHRLAGGGLTDPQSRGKTLFDARCASCHTGDRLTDSGAGNPTLDLAGPILLHDVGTCVTTGPFPDRAAPDDELGLPHEPCQFDTPSLRGIFATPPYFHDGSAATLGDVVDRLPFSRALSEDDKRDLVAYLLTL